MISYKDDEVSRGSRGSGSESGRLSGVSEIADVAPEELLGTVWRQVRFSTVGEFAGEGTGGKRSSFADSDAESRSRFSSTAFPTYDQQALKTAEELEEMKKENHHLKEVLEAERVHKDEVQTALEAALEVAGSADDERHQLEETHRQYVEQKELELNQLQFEIVQKTEKFEEEVKQLQEELTTRKQRESEIRRDLARIRWKVAVKAVKATRAKGLTLLSLRTQNLAEEKSKREVCELEAAVKKEINAVSMWSDRAESASKMAGEEKLETEVLSEQLKNESVQARLKMDELQEALDFELAKLATDKSWAEGSLALDMRPTDDEVLQLNRKIDALIDEREELQSECKAFLHSEEVTALAHSCEVACLHNELSEEREAVAELEAKVESLNPSEEWQDETYYADWEAILALQDGFEDVSVLKARLRESLDNALSSGEFAKSVEVVSGVIRPLRDSCERAKQELHTSNLLVGVQCEELQESHRQFMELEAQCEHIHASVAMIEKASDRLDAGRTETIQALRDHLRDEDGRHQRSISALQAKLRSELQKVVDKSSSSQTAPEQTRILDMQIELAESSAMGAYAGTLQAELVAMQKELSEIKEWQVSACELVGCQCKEIGLLRGMTERAESQMEDAENKFNLQVGLGLAAAEMQNEVAAAVAGLLRDREEEQEQLLAAGRNGEEQKQKIIGLNSEVNRLREECRSACNSAARFEEAARSSAEEVVDLVRHLERSEEMEQYHLEEAKELREHLRTRDGELLVSTAGYENAVQVLETSSEDRSKSLEELRKCSEDAAGQLREMEFREQALNLELATCKAESRIVRQELADAGPVLADAVWWGREEANALHVEALSLAHAKDEHFAALGEVEYLRRNLGLRETQLDRIHSLMGKIRNDKDSPCSNQLCDFGEALIGSPFSERSGTKTPDAYGVESAQKVKIGRPPKRFERLPVALHELRSAGVPRPP